MRAIRLAGAALAVFALAACATPGARPLSGPPPSEAAGSPAAQPAVVPDVTGVSIAAARRLVTGAKLVPVIRYAPEILVNAGSVMLSTPKAGAGAAVGDVVVLVVAGNPDGVSDGRTPGARALTDLAAAREEIFVGVGFAGNDMHNPLVVALAPGVDPSVWQDRLATAAGTQKFTVKVCDHSRAELLQIRGEVTGDGPHKVPMAVSVRPAECAVHVVGNLPADEKAALTERYGTAVVIQTDR
jgi:PASTA domain-containing protein